jgi:hypothetical protein
MNYNKYTLIIILSIWLLHCINNQLLPNYSINLRALLQLQQASWQWLWQRTEV